MSRGLHTDDAGDPRLARWFALELVGEDGAKDPEPVSTDTTHCLVLGIRWQRLIIATPAGTKSLPGLCHPPHDLLTFEASDLAAGAGQGAT